MFIHCYYYVDNQISFDYMDVNRRMTMAMNMNMNVTMNTKRCGIECTCMCAIMHNTEHKYKQDLSPAIYNMANN